MIILGINAYHGDVLLAFFESKLIAAVEEERFTKLSTRRFFN